MCLGIPLQAGFLFKGQMLETTVVCIYTYILYIYSHTHTQDVKLSQNPLIVAFLHSAPWHGLPCSTVLSPALPHNLRHRHQLLDKARWRPAISRTKLSIKNLFLYIHTYVHMLRSFGIPLQVIFYIWTLLERMKYIEIPWQFFRRTGSVFVVMIHLSL